MEILRKVGRYFGRRDQIEVRPGEASHIASALSQSDIRGEEILRAGLGPPGLTHLILGWLQKGMGAVGFCGAVDPNEM